MNKNITLKHLSSILPESDLFSISNKEKIIPNNLFYISNTITSFSMESREIKNKIILYNSQWRFSKDDKELFYIADRMQITLKHYRIIRSLKEIVELFNGYA